MRDRTKTLVGAVENGNIQEAISLLKNREFSTYITKTARNVLIPHYQEIQTIIDYLQNAQENPSLPVESILMALENYERQFALNPYVSTSISGLVKELANQETTWNESNLDNFLKKSLSTFRNINNWLCNLHILLIQHNNENKTELLESAQELEVTIGRVSETSSKKIVIPMSAFAKASILGSGAYGQAARLEFVADVTHSFDLQQFRDEYCTAVYDPNSKKYRYWLAAKWITLKIAEDEKNAPHEIQMQRRDFKAEQETTNHMHDAVFDRITREPEKKSPYLFGAAASVIFVDQNNNKIKESITITRLAAYSFDVEKDIPNSNSAENFLKAAAQLSFAKLKENTSLNIKYEHMLRTANYSLLAAEIIDSMSKSLHEMHTTAKIMHLDADLRNFFIEDNNGTYTGIMGDVGLSKRTQPGGTAEDARDKPLAIVNSDRLGKIGTEQSDRYAHRISILRAIVINMQLNLRAIMGTPLEAATQLTQLVQLDPLKADEITLKTYFYKLQQLFYAKDTLVILQNIHKLLNKDIHPETTAKIFQLAEKLPLAALDIKEAILNFTNKKIALSNLKSAIENKLNHLSDQVEREKSALILAYAYEEYLIKPTMVNADPIEQAKLLQSDIDLLNRCNDKSFILTLELHLNNYLDTDDLEHLQIALQQMQKSTLTISLDIKNIKDNDIQILLENPTQDKINRLFAIIERKKMEFNINDIEKRHNVPKVNPRIEALEASKLKDIQKDLEKAADVPMTDATAVNLTPENTSAYNKVKEVKVNNVDANLNDTHSKNEENNDKLTYSSLPSINPEEQNTTTTKWQAAKPILPPQESDYVRVAEFEETLQEIRRRTHAAPQPITRESVALSSHAETRSSLDAADIGAFDSARSSHAPITINLAQAFKAAFDAKPLDITSPKSILRGLKRNQKLVNRNEFLRTAIDEATFNKRIPQMERHIDNTLKTYDSAIETQTAYIAYLKSLAANSLFAKNEAFNWKAMQRKLYAGDIRVSIRVARHATIMQKAAHKKLVDAEGVLEKLTRARENVLGNKNLLKDITFHYDDIKARLNNAVMEFNEHVATLDDPLKSKLEFLSEQINQTKDYGNAALEKINGREMAERAADMIQALIRASVAADPNTTIADTLKKYRDETPRVRPTLRDIITLKTITQISLHGIANNMLTSFNRPAALMGAKTAPVMRGPAPFLRTRPVTLAATVKPLAGSTTALKADAAPTKKSPIAPAAHQPESIEPAALVKSEKPAAALKSTAVVAKVAKPFKRLREFLEPTPKVSYEKRELDSLIKFLENTVSEIEEIQRRHTAYATAQQKKMAANKATEELNKIDETTHDSPRLDKK